MLLQWKVWGCKGFEELENVGVLEGIIGILRFEGWLRWRMAASRAEVTVAVAATAHL